MDKHGRTERAMTNTAVKNPGRFRGVLRVPLYLSKDQNAEMVVGTLLTQR